MKCFCIILLSTHTYLPIDAPTYLPTYVSSTQHFLKKQHAKKTCHHLKCE